MKFIMLINVKCQQYASMIYTVFESLKGGASFVDPCLICVSYLSLILPSSCLFLEDLWSPAGEGLTSWLSCLDVFLVFCHFPIWCPASGVVLDCIDS